MLTASSTASSTACICDGMPASHTMLTVCVTLYHASNMVPFQFPSHSKAGLSSYQRRLILCVILTSPVSWTRQPFIPVGLA